MRELLAHISGLPPEVLVLVVAATPIIELRGAIPIAIGLGIPPWSAFLLGIAGNLVPVPFILWLLGPIRRALAQQGPLRPLFGWLERRTLNRRGVVDRYGVIGLALFVGVPLPGTGAWTGAALAILLDMPWRRSLPAIVAGVLMAAVIIGALSTFGWWVLLQAPSWPVQQ